MRDGRLACVCTSVRSVLAVLSPASSLWGVLVCRRRGEGRGLTIARFMMSRASSRLTPPPQSAWLATPPSPVPTQTYLEVLIYCVGFFLICVMLVVAIIFKIRSTSKKSDFNSQLAVHKLAKSIPLRRQVTESRWGV